MATRRRLKIGDLAAAIGVTTQTVRYYEELGLVAPSRTKGGTRVYSTSDMDRLRAIQRLVRLDTPLATLSALARARPTSPTGDIASRRVHGLLDSLAAEVAERLRRYQELSVEVEAALHLVRQCFGCERPPTTAGCQGCAVAETSRPPVLRDLVWP